MSEGNTHGVGCAIGGAGEVAMDGKFVGKRAEDRAGSGSNTLENPQG